MSEKEGHPLSMLPIPVSALLDQRIVESERIELKASWDEKRTGPQILKTLCAFANDLHNLNGGYVILGVVETKGKIERPVRGLSAKAIEAAQKWIRGQCNRLDPVYQPTLCPEQLDDRRVLVVWAPGSDNRPHRAPESLQKGAPSHFYIRLGNETVKARGTLETELLQQTAKIPFDDRRNLEAAVEDLREGMTREFLADIGSDLVREPSILEIYRRMRLVKQVNGHSVPRNVSLLFFNEAPERWFPGASIEVVQFAAGAEGNILEERRFAGALHHQLREALSYLGNLSTAHFEKVPERAETRGWVSYPFQAMEEALVNAIYHRSYEQPAVYEPTKVYLYPDRLEVISYPGPVSALEMRHFEPGARTPPAPARNRRIGELLKELRLAEGRGTGIPKVFREMERNGSPPPRFEFDESRTWFRVILPAHPEYVAISALRDAAHLKAIGDRAGALARLRRALEDHPRSSAIAVELIDELAGQGRIEEARKVFEELGSSAPPDLSTAPLLTLSKALLDAGHQHEARLLLDRLPGSVPPDEAFAAAIQERRAGRQERAHELFDHAGDTVWRDVRALHEFAQTKIKLARNRRHGPKGRRLQRETSRRLLEEAMAMLQRVVQMEAPPIRHAWAWFDLGRVLLWLKEPRSRARQAFATAVELAPDEERFRQRLAELDAMDAGEMD